MARGIRTLCPVSAKSTLFALTGTGHKASKEYDVGTHQEPQPPVTNKDGTAARRRPSVGPDGIVESGSGRTLALNTSHYPGAFIHKLDKSARMEHFLARPGIRIAQSG